VDLTTAIQRVWSLGGVLVEGEEDTPMLSPSGLRGR
jgi:hypothetical protein